ncbi:hypothetical protein A2U01_0118719, partial [Trifolium medium]|nr:hypothetical protein [Trifolium medium]
ISSGAEAVLHSATGY